MTRAGKMMVVFLDLEGVLIPEIWVGLAEVTRIEELKLTTRDIVDYDGNVLLEVQVNNDSVNRTVAGDPPINKMEISTKLLIADGDIVVIGGIKKNKEFNTKSQTPGLGNVPVLGNLFKGKTKSDSMDELLIFIAPRIL